MAHFRIIYEVDACGRDYNVNGDTHNAGYNSANTSSSYRAVKGMMPRRRYADIIAKKYHVGQHHDGNICWPRRRVDAFKI